MFPPFLIAGPLLRRVESRKVSVWLAFRKPYAEITLKIWEAGVLSHSGGDPGSKLFHTSLSDLPTLSATTSTVQFGHQLFVALVTAELPAPGLQVGQPYSYNVILSETVGGEKEDLRSHGLLDDKKIEDRPQLPIGYEKDTLPFFYLPEMDPARLMIAQGSCRGVRGNGPDALAYLDDILKKGLENDGAGLKLRPQQLFLTGDQIYADEAATLLGQYSANFLGFGPLIGFERIQTRENAGAELEDIPADIFEFPLYFRQRMMNKVAGFSSGDADRHVMAFQEFCTCYLQHFSLRSWDNKQWLEIKKVIDDPNKAAKAAEDYFEAKDPLDETIPSVIERIVAQFKSDAPANKYVFDDKLKAVFKKQNNPDFPFDDEKIEQWKTEFLTKKKTSLAHELLKVADFASVLPKVSRVLANIPTYMIFDDHEITDDWNLTMRWRNKVFSSPMGRDIVRNGLMAYVIFQDWGNVPDEYADAASPRALLFQKVRAFGERMANLTLDIDDDDTRRKAYLAELRAEVIAPMEILLGMGAEDPVVKWNYSVPTGPTQTIVMDTRTHRQFDTLNSAPGLIKEDALRQQIPPAMPVGDAPFVFVISPVPVLGLVGMEELVQPVASAVKGIFSGDNKDDPGIQAGRVKFDFEAWSFNTEAYERLLDRLNNFGKVIILSGDVHYGFSAVLDYWKGDAAEPTSRMVQLTSSSLKNMKFPHGEILESGMAQRLLSGFENKIEKVGWKDKILTTDGAVSARNRQRLRKTTAVVPTAGWEPGATVNLPPDFSWRMAFLADERVRDFDPITADIDLADPASVRAGYKLVTERHMETFIARTPRRIVWPPNVSLVSFEPDGDDWKVKHEFLFQKGNRDITKKEVGKHMQHVVSLKPKAEEQDPPFLP